MPYRILVVEDETLIGLDLSSTLEDEGFETVGIARDMFAALRMAEREHVDLATVDIQLARNTNGVDTALHLKEKHGVRSVFVSASLDHETRQRAAAAHPIGFIDKPVGADAVVAFVKAHFASMSHRS